MKAAPHVVELSTLGGGGERSGAIDVAENNSIAAGPKKRGSLALKLIGQGQRRRFTRWFLACRLDIDAPIPACSWAASLLLLRLASHRIEELGGVQALLPHALLGTTAAPLHPTGFKTAVLAP